ncbi:TPR-like protein [Calocera cornea HHB12733]|uniref:TPR-like protein n=1 Tax=Calocera cornea HHB12733 TaxID=1353952 RepID=A0A165GM73_9BASI|nr:TPR-like protein [Calocera cornea HHB12733]
MPGERWKDKLGQSAKFQAVTDAVVRLVGVQDVLKELDDTHNEWYRFTQHASQALEAVLDLPAGALQSDRVDRSIEDLQKFIPQIEGLCETFENTSNRKRLVDSEQYTGQLSSLRAELDDKVKLLQLGMDVEQRNFLQNRLDALDVRPFELALDSIRNDIENIPLPSESLPAILDTLPYASGASWNSLNRCMPGTRTALLNDVTHWMSTVDTAESAQIYWIVGVAGSGKTALANSISSIAADNGWLVSSFFFNRMSDERNRPDKFVTTVARDLAGRDKRIAEAISAKLGFDVSLRSTADLVRQFRELVLGPCTTWDRSRPAVVVVDALDEGCDDGILQVLMSEVVNLPGIFRFVVTSRPIAELAVAFDDAAHVKRTTLTTADVEGLHDVETYMRQRLATISRRRRLRQPWPEPALVDNLVLRAEGLFQWAFTVTEYLAKCLNPDRQLRLILSLQGASTISSRMDQLYATVLEATRAAEDDDFVDAYQSFVGSILAAKEPLTLAAMRLLHGETNVDPYDLLDQLRSLFVGIDTDHEAVRILHLSLREFLTQRAVEPFRISPAESSKNMAYLCVRLINERLKVETSSVPKLESYSHSGNVITPVSASSLSDGVYYAVSFWTRHLLDIKEPLPELLGSVLILMETQLQDWVSLTISLGSYGGFADLIKWLHIRGPKGLEAVLQLANKDWDSYLCFISELLRRNGRLEEACAAAEDSLAITFGLSWDCPEDIFSPSHDFKIPTSVRSRERGAFIARVAIEHIRTAPETHSLDHISTATMCLDQLLVCLTAMGQLEEVYQASEEVIKLRRFLATSNPQLYSAELAWSLGNFSESLARRGTSRRALDAMEEAVSIYRPLAHDQNGRYRENLAWSLGTLSKRLGELPIEQRQLEKALNAIEEAVLLYRGLATTNPVVYGPNLAWALGTLSNRLADVQRFSEGLEASEESVKLCHELLRRRPAEGMNPDLALQLRNLASRLWETGRLTDALGAIEQAITLYRQLCIRLPLRYSPELMRALYLKATCLMGLDHPKEALPILEEALSLLEPLVTQRPGLYKDSIRQYLGQLCSIYRDLGCSEEAEKAKRRAQNVPFP